jgi:hypothetical protein
VRRACGRLICALLGACGGDAAAPDAAVDHFELVGHADLGARGMNAALAVAGDVVYVGSRIDTGTVRIVDVSDPARPVEVGAIAAPDEGLPGFSSRELRAVPDLDLLIVLDLQCSPDLHGCGDALTDEEGLKLYDISDRRNPRRVGTYQFARGSPIRPRAPHEFFLWRDGARVLVHAAVPYNAPQFEIVDVSDPAAPAQVVAWDPITDGGLRETRGDSNLLHSVSVSRDGRTAWFSHLQGGVFAVDVGDVVDGVAPLALSLITPSAMVPDWTPPEPAGPHSAVPVPGRDLLIVTDEVYPEPYGAGCPWGWVHVVDVADPTAPVVVSEVKLPENEQACDGVGPAIAFTAHNTTATSNLAMVTWHSGGLVAIDLADPAAPRIAAQFRPEPLPAVAVEDPGLGGDPVTMWSYPVVQDGLIYVVDIRNGLYVLRYVGEHAEELEVPGPYEGNSAL